MCWFETFCDLLGYQLSSVRLFYECVHVTVCTTLSDTCTLLFPQNGDTPLHEAARNDKLDTVTVLVQSGSDLSVLNKVSVIVNW